MPKIIDHLEEQIREAAKDQVLNLGYDKTTIRSVAKKCGIGVGTVYNYFSSKEELVASFMIEDWHTALGSMKALSTQDPEAFLRGIHLSLLSFINAYRPLFSQAGAYPSGSVFAERHRQLCDVLGGIILPLCSKTSEPDPEYLSVFLAEALLSRTMRGDDFEQIYGVLKRLL